MRISDWSSDVCSSDLFAHLFDPALLPQQCIGASIKWPEPGFPRVAGRLSLAGLGGGISRIQIAFGRDQVFDALAIQARQCRCIGPGGWWPARRRCRRWRSTGRCPLTICGEIAGYFQGLAYLELARSEERRGGKECVSTCISRW